MLSETEANSGLPSVRKRESRLRNKPNIAAPRSSKHTAVFGAIRPQRSAAAAAGAITRPISNQAPAASWHSVANGAAPANNVNTATERRLPAPYRNSDAPRAAILAAVWYIIGVLSASHAVRRGVSKYHPINTEIANRMAETLRPAGSHRPGGIVQLRPEFTVLAPIAMWRSPPFFAGIPPVWRGRR